MWLRLGKVSTGCLVDIPSRRLCFSPRATLTTKDLHAPVFISEIIFLKLPKTYKPSCSECESMLSSSLAATVVAEPVFRSNRIQDNRKSYGGGLVDRSAKVVKCGRRVLKFTAACKTSLDYLNSVATSTNDRKPYMSYGRFCGRMFFCLASPSVTFVLPLFGGSPLHERKGIPLPTRGV